MDKSLEAQLDQCAEYAIDTWDSFDLLHLLQEECAELITAISHLQRGKEGAHSNVLEEMADVTIMLSIGMHALAGTQGEVDSEKEVVECLEWLRKKSARMIENANGGKPL